MLVSTYLGLVVVLAIGFIPGVNSNPWRREVEFPLSITMGSPDERPATALDACFIEVQADGKISFDSITVASADDRLLHRLLEALVLKRLRREDSRSVIVKVHPQASYRRLIEVLNAFEAAGMKLYAVVIGEGAGQHETLWKK